MERSTFSFTNEPRGELLRRLLAYGALCSNRVGVVVRDQLPRQESLDAALRQLEPFLESDAHLDAWPGTQLLGHKAKVLQYLVEDALVEALIHLSDSLFGWLQPALPEDLFFPQV